MELQDQSGRVVADKQPRQRGWAVVEKGNASRARLCETCDSMRTPAWPNARVCGFCYIGDYEKAWRQWQEQVRRAYANSVARGEAA
jgi:hypothetical protein